MNMTPEMEAQIFDEPETCDWEYGAHREPNRPEWRSGCGRIHPTMLSEDWHDLCPYCRKPVHVTGLVEEDE